MKRNRQIRAFVLMRRLSKRMAQEMGCNLSDDDMEVMLEIRNNYYDHVGRVNDNIRRFDLVSIIA